jgi:uncharacterized C2H2 Zn-finger protein
MSTKNTYACESNKKTHKCNTCKETFNSLTKLSTHTRVEHQVILDFTYLGEKHYVIRNEENFFVCPLCRGMYKYKYPSSFHQHIGKKHRNLTQMNPPVKTATDTVIIPPSNNDYEQDTRIIPFTPSEGDPLLSDTGDLSENIPAEETANFAKDSIESSSAGNEKKRGAVSPSSSDRCRSKKRRYQLKVENGKGFVMVPYLEFLAFINRFP